MSIEADALETLSRVSGGDLRKAITTLQSAVRLRGSPVTAAAVLDVSGAVPRSAVEALLAAARSKQFAAVQQAVTDLIAEGYPVGGWVGNGGGVSVRGGAWWVVVVGGCEWVGGSCACVGAQGSAQGRSNRAASAWMESGLRRLGCAALLHPPVLPRSPALAPCCTDTCRPPGPPRRALQAQEILLQLQGALLEDASVADSAKGRVLLRLAEADKKLVDGADEFLQLLDVTAHAQQVLRGLA